MRHKGVEFTIRARPGRNQWTYTILPQGDAPIIAAFTGAREDAIARAHISIDRFLAKRRLQEKKLQADSLGRGSVSLPAEAE
jgi:hypothetical protein